MVTLEELLNDETIQDIIKYAKQYDLDKVVLFGSRAKGIAQKFSDYDLLIYGGNSGGAAAQAQAHQSSGGTTAARQSHPRMPTRLSK